MPGGHPNHRERRRSETADPLAREFFFGTLRGERETARGTLDHFRAWHYVAKRPKHLGEMPMMLDHPTLEEDAEAIDAYEIEPVVWMAEHGHLEPDEIAAIEAEAREASRRVGTDEERIGSAGADMADRRAVKLWDAVEEMLRAGY